MDLISSLGFCAVNLGGQLWKGFVEENSVKPGTGAFFFLIFACLLEELLSCMSASC